VQRQQLEEGEGLKVLQELSNNQSTLVREWSQATHWVGQRWGHGAPTMACIACTSGFCNPPTYPASRLPSALCRKSLPSGCPALLGRQWMSGRLYEKRLALVSCANDGLEKVDFSHKHNK
jgi:hypothetical protein